MRSPIDDEIRQIFDQCAGLADGRVASYIPELAGADPAAYGLCIMSVEGQGDLDVARSRCCGSRVMEFADPQRLLAGVEGVAVR